MAYLAAEERRRRIIDAAVEVIAAEGLARTTTRRIAEQADAPLGALHYCFRNKDELITLIAERGATSLQAAFDDVERGHGLERTLRDSIAAMWRWYQDNIGLQFALTEMGMERIRRGGRPSKIYTMWRPFGGDILRERLTEAAEREPAPLGLSVDEMVRFILHRFDGLTIEFAASKDRVACGRQVEILADAMVALSLGAAPRPATAPASHRRQGSPPR